MTNMAIWDKLAKTDPAHTKPFKRAGGFSGTAMKPIWMVKRLTEEFGAVGEGWGMGEPQFTLVDGGEEGTAVHCVVKCWHGTPENSFYGVGGDKAVGKNKYGLFLDDEAFKKAYTDAIGNAFKFLGAGADIHMGLFDDSKYVQATEKEFANDEGDGLPPKPWRRPPPRTKLEGEWPSASKLAEHFHGASARLLKCQSDEDIDELVRSMKPALKAAAEVYTDLLNGDPDNPDIIGFRGEVAKRRAEVETSTSFQLLASTLAECDTKQDYAAWEKKNGAMADELCDLERARLEELCTAKEAGLNEVANVAAG